MKHISSEQRYQIEAYLKAGKSKDFIADELNLHRSSIFREVSRNAQKEVLILVKQLSYMPVSVKKGFVLNVNLPQAVLKFVI